MEKKIEEENIEEDEYAEIPEKVLDLEDLKELELMKKASEEETKKTDESWTPITKLGREVKSGKIKSIDEILKLNKKILEVEIIDYLWNTKTDLLSIGQSKGKFGGGKRRA
jgi:small subunit ribosomal protein S5